MDSFKAVMNPTITKDSFKAVMDPTIIKMLDGDGYSRRIVVRKPWSCTPHLSFHDFAAHIRKIYKLPSDRRVRIVYKKEGEMAAAEDDLEFEAACFDAMPGQSIQAVPEQYVKGSWYRLNSQNPVESVMKTMDLR
ncbi:hypothetical protein SUGI_1084360 [Cryptomeria japonica]|uniref:uncharacterized protein LOC131076849 n=1 Tax=Cryptomeria japonica TaxID=3369 RepID=UPI0024149B8E|nr:uncharacterized protein LOC131076849 [Cryptomeria japonica]XP_059069649.1 uncharacterized protein LOC131076849 [Cryptomeria japonica]GLJ50922.1 hypothetical protein SUGI_1084360 [Cryptomeria japonica]